MVPFCCKVDALRREFPSVFDAAQSQPNRMEASALSLERAKIEDGTGCDETAVCLCAHCWRGRYCLPQQRFSFALKVEGQASGGTRLGSLVARAPSQSATSRLG